MIAAATLTKRQLPSGWRWVKLGEVCEIEMGQSPPGTSYNENGTGKPLLNGPTEFGDKHPLPVQWTTIPTKLAREGDILFCVRGATTGRKNVADRGYCIGRGIASIRSKEGRSFTEFIWFLLDVVTESLLEKASGSTFVNLPGSELEAFPVPLPPLPEQKRIAAVLKEQMAAVDKARAAAQARLEAVKALPAAFARETLRNGCGQSRPLGECLVEIRSGVGAHWSKYPVLGATRDGLALAKAPVGKAPDRYKFVDPVTVFYNPMRILLGSIAMVDDVDATGITSPDYVVVKGRPGILDTRWFYYWFRSTQGAHLIESLSRGAVRERILFNRLAAGSIEIPDYETQVTASERMKQTRPAVEAVTKELEAINALPAALLRRAFNGEI